jgi:hypothetical protein
MKKLLPLCVLLVMASSANAQYKPILFGLKVGSNLSWVNPDTEGYSGEGALAGFTWGFIGEFFIMENYAILTGFNVDYIGGKMKYPYLMDVNNDHISEPGELTRKYNLRYIQVPLCLKMRTALSDKLGIFAKIGLGTSFRIDAKGTDDFVYEGGEYSSSKKNIEDEIALIRESLIVGGGIELSIKGSTALILEFTYDNAFNNMLTGGNPASGTDPNQKAMVNFVELGAGIVF